MKRSSPSLKNRPKRVYVFFVLYLLLCSLIVAESCFPGSLSSKQSGFVGNVVAFFANLFPDTVVATRVDAKAISLKSDSTVLNRLDPTLEKPSIVRGTTTLLTFDVEYPNLGKGDYKNPDFSVTSNDEEGTALYTLAVDASSQNVRIVSLGASKEDCSITIKASGTAEMNYSFSIVDSPAPEYYAATLAKSEIKVNESSYFLPKLKCPDSVDLGKSEEELDPYLRRYFDVGKIPVTVSDSSALDVNEYGVIKAKREGNYQVRYGTLDPVTLSVSGTAVGTSAYSAIKISKSVEEASISPNDYDYSSSGVSLFSTYTSSAPEDTGVTFVSSDPLKAKIIYVDSTHATVKGYRKRGTVRISAISNLDASVSDFLDLETQDIVPDAMALFVKGEAIPSAVTKSKGTNLVISASFTNPSSENITNRDLVAVSDNENILISGSGSQYLTISFSKAGSSVLNVTSEANPSLSQKINFTIEPEQNVDPSDENFGTFIRKSIGHFGLFLLAGLLGGLFFYFFFGKKEDLILSLGVSTAGGGLLAMLTEFIQHFVPGRYGAWKDVGIDFAGYLLASLLIWLVIFLVGYFSKKKLAKKPAAKEP